MPRYHFAKKKLRTMQLVKCAAANSSLILNFQEVVWIRNGNLLFFFASMNEKKVDAINGKDNKVLFSGQSNYRPTVYHSYYQEFTSNLPFFGS